MNKTIENLKKLKSFHNGSYGSDINKAIIAIEFAEWVAEEIFSEDWEFNKDSFEKIACRKETIEGEMTEEEHYDMDNFLG